MAKLATSLELGIDAIADVFSGHEFVEYLRTEHAKQRVVIAFRVPEVVYVDEVETPSGFPALEIVAGTDAENSDNDSTEIVHELSMQWTVNGDDPIIMSREVKRLIAASRALFKAGTMLPYVGGRFWTSDAVFGPTSGGRDQRYVKSAALRVFWRTFGI